MSLERALFTHLGTVTAVTALIGTRFYPSQAPQGAAMPYVVHHRISESRQPNYASATGTVRTRMQFDCIAAKYDDALSVAEEIRTALDGWRATVMGTDSLFFKSVELDDRTTLYAPPNDGTDTPRHRVTDDYAVLYAESIPTPT